MAGIERLDLTERERSFCRLYFEYGNGTRAAVSAGYSEKGASVQAVRLLARPSVQAELARLRSKDEKKTASRRDRILAELEKMAFSNISNLIVIDENGLPQVDFSRATPEQLAAVNAVKTKRRTIYNGRGEIVGVEDNAQFSLADKYRGLELLGKAEGMFADETKVVVDVADRLLAARRRLAQVTDQSGDDTE